MSPQIVYYIYLFVLVGSDRQELRLLEHVCPEGGVGQLQDVVGPNEVEAGLVLVHGVQDRLEGGIRNCYETVRNIREKNVRFSRYGLLQVFFYRFLIKKC